MKWMFTKLDLWVAWRHLRMGHEPPAWVWPLIVGAIYVIAVGAGLTWHAANLDPETATELSEVLVEVAGSDVDLEAMGPTPMERYYGAFGRLTLYAGVMALTLGLLSLFFNLLPTIITMSVLLGCMALVVVLSLMSGLEGDLRDKILNQKAHIRISREDARPFGDYASLADALAQAKGIAGASPYLEGEIMVRSGLNRQGAILSGIIPERHTTVSNLPEIIENGEYRYLLHPEEVPESDPFAIDDGGTPWRLRHLEGVREKSKKVEKLPSRVGDDPLEEEAAAPMDTSAKGEPSLGVAGMLIAGGSQDEDEPIPEEEAGAFENAGDSSEEPPEDPPEDENWEDPQAEEGPAAPAPNLPEPPPEMDRGGGWGEEGWEDPAQALEDEPELPSVDDPELDEKPDERRAQEGDDERVLDPLLIGRELSMELGVRVGDDVQLINAVGRMTPAGMLPGILATKVGAVFFSGMYEYDRKNVYAPLDVVQRFLLTGDRVSGIEVKLVDVEAIDEGKATVERIVKEAGRDDELVVEDWRDLNRNLFSAMFLEKVAMFIALLFVVLVASFGILASNLMSVMEKSKEIAIFKAMGDTDQAVMRRFIAEGLCVGFLGSFGGIAMGLALCWDLDSYGFPLNPNVYYIEKLPVVVNPVEVAMVGVAALVIVCISSLYPALVAARLRPVDACRQADQ